jgi:hypothetical protein
LLEQGATEQELRSARKVYWAEYRKQWRRNARKSNKEVVITFDKDEYKQITDGAIKHKKNKTKFLKQCVFAYLNQRFIFPDEKEMKRLSQNMAMYYLLLKDLMELRNVNFDFKSHILKQVEEIERDVLVILHNPIKLEKYIKKGIAENTFSKDELIELIKNI